MNEIENTTTVVEEGDALMPDGWHEGMDIFNEGSWTGTEQGDASGEETEEQTEETTDEQPAAPTPEQEGAPGDEAAAGAPGKGKAFDGGRRDDEAGGYSAKGRMEQSGVRPDAAPTTEPAQQQTNKLRFKARVDRQDLDVEMDESELPTMYQKAQATDRYRARMAEQDQLMEQLKQVARSMGKEDPAEFLSTVRDNYQRSEIRRLVGDGVHEEVAKDMVERRFAPVPQAPAAEPETAAAQQKAPTRDFAAEIAQLRDVYPDAVAKPIPKEVLGVTMDKDHPKPLLVAYTEYIVGQQKAEAEALRKENEILKQNAAAAARAPVSGVSGGGATDTKSEDDFLKGFNDGW